MIRSLRGMNDMLPPKNMVFVKFIEQASSIAIKYGFEFVSSPLLEETSLFKRSVGDSSDIVGKEMYRFFDKGENDVCLRPEGTAGIVRAFIQNKLDKKGGIHRFFYHGAMFRYERPQKGRLRQFHQFGCESFGEQSVYEDANIILMLKEILNSFNIKTTLKINSLGCSKCMPPYKKNLVSFLEINKDELCEDCHRRIGTNPIRVLDCKNEKCQNSLINAPKLLDNLCNSCKNDFDELHNLLRAHNVEFEIDNHLVRGLDYYTKTAFEFVSHDIGAQSSIAGGGRYDTLVEMLDGKSTPAVGFAIGVERLLELIEKEDEDRDGYYFGALDENGINAVFEQCIKKRKTDKCYIEYKPKALKKHLNSADKLNARYCAVIGDNELNQKKIWIKDMKEKNEFFENFS